jgi:putative ABC transport system substrate-binding protein
MRRREFVTLLGGAAAIWPLAVQSQTVDKRLIGYLETGRGEAVKDRVAAFVAGMRDLGYVEGQTFDIAYRFADNDYRRLPALAEELVRLQPDVIVTAVTTAALAAAKATRTIPIVSAILNDPIHAGMIASYTQPGGNVTGIMNTIEGLPGKLVEITLELVPRAARIGILINPGNLANGPQQREIETAAAAKGLRVDAQEIRTPGDLPSAFKALSSGGAEAVIVSRDTVLLGAAVRVAELALAARLPTISGQSEEARAGQLVSYGASLTATTRRAAYFVDRILKGAKPADLPVEFPTKLELIINLKTAKALGVDVLPTLLVRADEVIE